MTVLSWPQEIYLLIGCTAVGKTEAGIQWAQHGEAEIISADSMLVYRGMDIGTAKPDREQQSAVAHHLIDAVDPWESFSLGRYLPLADAAICAIHRRSRRVLVVGGTGLYLKAIATGIFDGPPADPAVRKRLNAEAAQYGCAVLHERLAQVDGAAAGRIHRNDAKRIIRALEVFELTGTPISEFQTQFDSPQRPFRVHWLGLQRDSEQLNRRINARAKAMFDNGLVEETRALLSHPNGMSMQARKALGYQQVIAYLEDRLSLDDAIEQLKIATRRLAKAQRTWFRSFGAVRWFDAEAALSVAPPF